MEPSSGDSTNENIVTTSAVSSDNIKTSETSETVKTPTPTPTETTTTQTSSSSSSSWWNSGWNSLIQTAKEKSATAIEIMRSDLAEFKSTMSADTNRLVNTLTHVDVDSTASAATGNLLNSLSSLSNALGINSLISGMAGEETTTDENEKKPASNNAVVTSPPSGNVHDRFKADIKQLQTDEATFINDVQSPEFEQWVASFNPDEFKSTISDLLIDNSAMRLIYSQLVPAQMSNNQFWSRYFFKVNQLEEDYKKRVQLLEKASRTTTMEATSNKEESNDWEDDDSPSQNSTTKAEISPKTTEETSNKEEDEKKTSVTTPVTEEVETTTTKEATQSNSSITTKPEETDDWEKLSDVDNQVDQSKKKAEKEETDGVEADSSKLSEVEVPRSNNRKETENDWEDWDE